MGDITKTQNIRRIFALFSLVFLYSFKVPLYSQETADNSSQIENNDTSSTQRITDETQIFLDQDNASSQNTRKSSSGIWVFIRMIFVLAVIIGLLYLFLRLYKKNKNVQQSEDPFLRLITSLSLGPGKSIYLLTVIDKAYLLGATDENINLLGQIDDKEVVEAMNVYADTHNQTEKPKNFNEILDMFVSGIKRSQKKESTKSTKKSSSNGSRLDGSASQILSSLKKTRSRLEGEDK